MRFCACKISCNCLLEEWMWMDLHKWRSLSPLADQCKPFADSCTAICFSRFKADLWYFLAVSFYLWLSVWDWERCRRRAEGPSGADIRLLQNFGLVPLGYYVMKQLFGAWCWSQSHGGVPSPLPTAIKPDLWVMYQCFSHGAVCVWQALETLGCRSFHLVLYCCKHRGFGWLNIDSGGVSPGATSLEQMFVLLGFRPALACGGSLLLHRAKPSVLSADVKPWVSLCWET